MRLKQSAIDKLATCHDILRLTVEEVSDFFNITVSCGYRDQVAQDDAYEHKKSQVKWPNSKHNTTPSVAVDIAPLDQNEQCIWNDVKLFGYIAGYMIATGKKHGINIVWGGDWNGNGQVNDQNFHDLPHFEIKQ